MSQKERSDHGGHFDIELGEERDMIQFGFDKSLLLDIKMFKMRLRH